MLSEIGIWLWAAKLRDTTKESSWIQLFNNLMQFFKASVVDSCLQALLWSRKCEEPQMTACSWQQRAACKSCRTLVLQVFRFSFTTEVNMACTWFSKFSLHLLYFMHVLWFICVWVWEWKRKLTDLSISHHFSVMLLDGKWKKKKKKTHQAMKKHF